MTIPSRTSGKRRKRKRGKYRWKKKRKRKQDVNKFMEMPGTNMRTGFSYFNILL